MQVPSSAARTLALYRLAGGPIGWLRITPSIVALLLSHEQEHRVPIAGVTHVIGSSIHESIMTGPYLGEAIFVARELYQQRLYEAFDDFTPQPGWTVIDAGANSGLFTVRAARLGARVLAFEPNSQCAQWLRKTIGLNKLEDRVTLFECALGSEEAVAHLDTSQGTLGAHIVPIERTAHFPRISIQRLDKFAMDCRLNHADLLKVDVEGYELEVLRGAERILDGIDRIVLEFHSLRLLRDCRDVLRRHDLLQVGIQHTHPELGFGNAFFKRAPATN